jgi:hypothetical protein
MYYTQHPIWKTAIYIVSIVVLIMMFFLSLAIPGVSGNALSPRVTVSEWNLDASMPDDGYERIAADRVEKDLKYAPDLSVISDRSLRESSVSGTNLLEELCQYEDLNICSNLVAVPDWMAEGNQPDAWFGWSVATAGDVNGDDYSDLIVGAFLYDNEDVTSGRVFVFHGSPGGLGASPDWTAEGDQANAHFGRSVGTAGDVNGDGYSDVIVGAPFYDNGEEDEGRAYVYYGSSTGLNHTPAWIAESNQAGAEFGRVIASAGDVNGDGFSDVIIGARYYDNGQLNEGAAFVYYGSSTGLSGTPDWSAEGDQEGAEFGRSVGSAGDINGDGYADIIIGAPSYDTDQGDEGRVFVYYGSAGGLRTTTEWIMSGSDMVGFGWSVASAGDVNGDGYGDIIIGAPYYGISQPKEGRAFVYHGSNAGLSLSHDWLVEGNQPLANLGWSVSTAGDVNWDGYSDIMVGAPVYDSGELNEGRAYLFYGYGCGISAIPALEVEGDQSYAWLGISVNTAGDVNGDDFDDVVVGAPLFDNNYNDEGRAYVFHGEPNGQNLPPISDAGDDQVVFRGTVTSLDGSGSRDLDCDYSLSYLWEQSGGPEITLSDPTVISPTFSAPPDPTVLTFTLTVTDSLGMVDPTPDEVVITVINQPPVADAGPDQYVDTGVIVTLDGSASNDPESDYPLSYLWMQTSGPDVTLSDPTSISPTFTAPSEPVIFIFTLTVTDSLGLADSTPDEVRIMVGGALGYSIYLPVITR